MWWQELAERLDRLPVEPSQVAVALAVAAVLLVAGVSWVLASSSPPPGPPVEELLPRADATSTTAVAGGAGSGTGGAAPASGEVVVHVAGAVARPGLHRLTAPVRVADAIAAAGGATAAADVDRLNLAAPVADGERVYIPRRGEPVPEPVGGVSAAAARGASPSPTARGTPERLDLNTATVAQLEALPGIGPATAQAIVEHRTRHGPFRTVRQLLDVRGIGEAKLAALEPRLRT